MEIAVMETPKTTKAETATKLTLPLKALQKAMATVAPAVERKTTIPILSTVRVEQHADELEFAGTNLDLSITVKVATPDAKPSKAFLLPAIKLNEYAKLLSGEEVSLTVKDERATLRCGRSTTKLLSTLVANFPMIAKAPNESSFALSQGVLDRLLRYVGFAISNEEARYTLAGALLEVASGKLSLIATDGHRLARYSIPSEADKLSALLPSLLITALSKTLDSESKVPVWLELSKDGIFATVKDASGAIEISSRRMTGTFPNYQAVMPSKVTASLKINATEAAAAVKRCLSLADANSGAVKLTIDQTEIKLHSASTESGETDEFIDVGSASVEGDFAPFSVGFNGHYLLDAFSRLAGDVEIRFSELAGQSAMMLVASPQDGELFEYIIMPMRV